MMTLQCPHCGAGYTFTEEEVNQLIMAGMIYFDCLKCANEILLERGWANS